MQEVYEIVDANDELFVSPPEETGIIDGGREEGDSKPDYSLAGLTLCRQSGYMGIRMKVRTEQSQCAP